MRIAIFGGTFNPIHKGHIFLARQAKKTLELDKVIFVPSYLPPHKSAQGIIDADDRCRMIELAISGNPDFGVSRHEIDKQKTAYSVDTIRYFKGYFPKDTQLFFIIGADSLEGLDRWRDADKIFDLCEFIAFSRPGFRLTKRKNRGPRGIEINALGVSSTQVRERVKNNVSIKGLVPKPVADYIKRRRLYKARSLSNNPWQS
jgi:nicotinate-nucleotide adenylyltransferase